jgi:aspartokinase/homoserine dehydrogenase 2
MASGRSQGVIMSVIAQAGAKGRQLHKFGGSSLADVKCYLRVAGIMTEYSQPGDMMVVSAAGSTTNQLISWLKLSQTDRLSAHQVQQSLRRYQSELIAGLLPADVADGLISAFIHDLERLAACWTAALPMRCMPKWSATVKCGPRA